MNGFEAIALGFITLVGLAAIMRCIYLWHRFRRCRASFKILQRTLMNAGAPIQWEVPKRWHDLKCWPVYFQAIINGTKPLDVRKNDRGFRTGDGLTLHEWHPTDEEYTGRIYRVAVTYVGYGLTGVQDGHAVMGIRPVVPRDP